MPDVAATAIDWSGAVGDTGAGDSWIAYALQGVADRERESAGARLAAYFLHRGLPAAEVVDILEATFGRRSTPPVLRDAVTAMVDAIVKRDAIVGTLERSVAPEHVSKVLGRVLTQLQSSDPPKVCGTPYPTLNWLLNGGFSPGELVYLGARPGIGKTALALDFARSASAKGDVLIVSREMLNDALGMRLIAQQGRVHASSLKTKKLADADFARIVAAVGELANRSMWLTDQAISIGEVAEVLRQLPGGQPWSLVIVDYLQLIRAPKDVKDRRLQVEYVSHTLKTLALQHQVPVVCLSSLSRPAQGNPEPTLASLRESGELEHDADVVLLLHKPDETQPDVRCRVAKNRSGALGTVDLLFRAEYVTFDERATPQQEREWTR